MLMIAKCDEWMRASREEGRSESPRAEDEPGARAHGASAERTRGERTDDGSSANRCPAADRQE